VYDNPVPTSLAIPRTVVKYGASGRLDLIHRGKSPFDMSMAELEACSSSHRHMTRSLATYRGVLYCLTADLIVLRVTHLSRKNYRRPARHRTQRLCCGRRRVRETGRGAAGETEPVDAGQSNGQPSVMA